MLHKRIKCAFRIVILVLIVCTCTTYICLGATPVIPLGSWSLGDSYEIRYGQENVKAYSYEDLQNSYIKNCIDTKNIELNLQTNELQYQQYTLQLSSISSSIEKYKQLAEQYNALAKTYEDEMNQATGSQKDTAAQNMQHSLLNAQSYELQIAEAVSQKAEIYVQKENCLFINTNATMFRNQQLITQLSQFRTSVYEIKLLDEKYDEQGTLSEYAKLQENAQNINKVKDMSFQTDVDFYNADFEYCINQQEMFKQQFNNTFEELLNSANIMTTTSQGIAIKTDLRGLRALALISYNSIESNSNASDLKLKQLADKLRIINGKINILKEYYTDNSNQVKLALNEKTLAALELNKWIIQRKEIIQNTYAIYKSKYNEIGINEKKAKAQYEKYVILLNKYNFGLTSRILVKEAELNYVQSNLTAWNTLMEYTNALGRVENCMSGSIK